MKIEQEKSFIQKNINIFPLIILLITVHFFTQEHIFSYPAYITILPIILSFIIYDTFNNRNSSILNFTSLAIIAFIYIYICNNSHLFLYSTCLIFILFFCIMLNKIKNEKTFKNTTIIIVTYTLIFYLAATIEPDIGYKKDLITNKIGYFGFITDKNKQKTEFKIPTIYNKLTLIGGECPCFEATIKGEKIFINYKNENIFSNAEDVEFLGYNDTTFTMFFKVKENGKYGIYGFFHDSCYEVQKANEQTTKYPDKKIIVPCIYDEITPIEVRGFIINKKTNISAIIAKKDNKYDLFVKTNISNRKFNKDNTKELEYIRLFENKNHIKLEKTITFILKNHSINHKKNKQLLHLTIDEKPVVIEVYY